MGDDAAGFVQVSDGVQILTALERFLARPSAVAETFSWSEFGHPVIDRGDAAIYPLAVASVAEGGDVDAVSELAEMEYGLARYCVHFYGGDDFHAENEVDLEDGFGRNLLASGAIVQSGSSLNWWAVRSRAAVLVRSHDPDRSILRLALHVVPREWLSDMPLNSGTKREASRHRRIAKQRAASDVAWSWPLPDEAR
ncbi:MAG TPA: hypothetical protein VNJ54_20935 [Plantibacter sp.]|uniref:hypothetical protein n=1 Tax=unclassified Plantibacter TaxID=2624265 RepID=UPI002D18B4DC|nr:hypothetical protein [Plantibacter sp.]